MIYSVTPEQKAELWADWQIEYPEFNTLSQEMYNVLMKRALIYLPGRIFLTKSRSCPWEVQGPLINLIIAHIIDLYSLMDREDGLPPSPLELQRTAQSLSEGGLSASYYDIFPQSTTPQALYDWLSRTAYGDLAKILVEKCLSGAVGVLLA